MNYLKLLLPVLFLPSLLIAQSPCGLSIKGQIHSLQTGESIPGVIIFIKGTNQYATTDSVGNYELKNICPGHYILVAELSSFDKQELEIHLEKDAIGDINLNEQNIQLKNVAITAHRTEASSQLSEKLSALIIRERRGENLGNILKGLTGVESLQTGSTISKPVIHGMHSSRVIILNQGIRQEGQQWGSEHAPEIDPFISKNIQVIKGPAGLRYGGDAIGGVILMEPDLLPDTAGISGELQSVYFSNGRQWVGSGYIQGGFNQLKNLGWRIQGTIKNGGNTSSANYSMANTGIREGNFSAALGYIKNRWKQDVFFSSFNTKIGIFAGSHIGNINDLERSMALNQPLEQFRPNSFIRAINNPRQEVNHLLSKYKTSFELPNNGILRATFSHQLDNRKEFDIPRNNKVENLYFFKLNTFSGEWVYDELNKNQAWRGLFGINFQYQENMTSGSRVRRPSITSSLLPNYLSMGYGIFGIEKMTKEKYEIELGGRIDLREMGIFLNQGPYSTYINKIEKSYVGTSGSIGGKYHWSHQFDQSLTIARAFRPPSVNELFSNGVHHGAGAFEIGNTHLKGEKSLNISLNNEFSVGPIEAEIGFYTNLIQDYIYLQPMLDKGLPIYTITVRGAFPSFHYTQLNAQFSGIDATLNSRIIDHLTFTQKYSLIQARDINSSTYLVNIPTNRGTWGINYVFDEEKQTIGISWTQVGKQIRYTSGTDFLAPPPGYGLMEINWDFHYKNLGGGIRISNALNTEYRDYLNRFRYYTADLGRNISFRINYQI